MMNVTLRLLMLFMVVALALPSCVSKKKFLELEDQKNQLSNSLAESQKEVKMLGDKVSDLETTLESEKTRLNGEIASIKSDLSAAQSKASAAEKAAADKDAELARIKKEVRGALGLDSGVAVTEKGGNLYVTMESPVNYRSGSSRLNRDARKSIKALAESLKSNPNMHLLIEGHTDSQTFGSDAGMDNWQLSVNRAMSVVKRLIREGVSAEQLTVAGRGANEPSGDNTTSEGRAENRRTVVKPAPNTGTLIKIGGN